MSILARRPNPNAMIYPPGSLEAKVAAEYDRIVPDDPEGPWIPRFDATLAMGPGTVPARPRPAPTYGARWTFPVWNQLPAGVTRGQDTTLRALIPDSPFDGALRWNGNGWEGDVMEPDERDWYDRNVAPAFRLMDGFIKRLQGPEQQPDYDGAGSGGTRG